MMMLKNNHKKKKKKKKKSFLSQYQWCIEVLPKSNQHTVPFNATKERYV